MSGGQIRTPGRYERLHCSICGLLFLGAARTDIPDLLVLNCACGNMWAFNRRLGGDHRADAGEPRPTDLQKSPRGFS